MKLKTSITIIGGCLIIFIFIMLPLVLSIQDKKEDYVASITGSSFSLTESYLRRIKFVLKYKFKLINFWSVNKVWWFIEVLRFELTNLLFSLNWW